MPCLISIRLIFHNLNISRCDFLSPAEVESISAGGDFLRDCFANHILAEEQLIQDRLMSIGKRTFLGFGLGPIQAGLFLYEAFVSNSFERLVVAEINPQIVSAIRKADGNFFINIAFHDHIERKCVGPVEIYNPLVAEDREKLISAVTEANEIATAVPSVDYYVSEGEGSLHQILAAGLDRRITQGKPPVLIYAAENNIKAAELLESAVLNAITPDIHSEARNRFQFANTVIAKMSQTVHDKDEIERRNLAPITESYLSAFLVEAFNKILISKIYLPEPFIRGISVFIEKEKGLIPFEEAKLYGHNATHALIGFTSSLKGYSMVQDVTQDSGIKAFIEKALIDESGKALIKKYQGFDPLFTEEGFNLFAEDLIDRVFNPLLGDNIDRLTRDIQRKLGWDDRLIGTIRLCLGQGIIPHRYAFGVAAALVEIDPLILQERHRLPGLFDSIWRDTPTTNVEKEQIIKLTLSALDRLQHWINLAYPPLDNFFGSD